MRRPSSARDPRLYQIVVLGSLLAWGGSALDFPVGAGSIALLIGTALATQFGFGRFFGVRFDPRSPLISALSLCLLARAGSAPWLALTAVAAIASKFLIRRHGKHVFNPTNFGLGALALFSGGQVWISPGQWGGGAILVFTLAAAGGLVVHRAARADVTWAFLAAYSGLVLARGAWLGDPWAVPLHSLANGALAIFAFFMISDPKTTPDSRAGRVFYAAAVAALAVFIQFGLHRPAGLIWALLCAAPLVPFFDRLFPGERYRWDTPPPTKESHPMPMSTPAFRPVRILVRPLLLVVALVFAVAPTFAFCGFYVAKADTRLFNRASQVVMVRDGQRTVVTMANDFRGDPEDFAIVIPVPTALEREQIHVTEQAIVDHLDAYTAPRLVEYFDGNPCAARPEARKLRALGSMLRQEESADAAQAYGVRIEAKYTVGEYDILILSAEESRGLQTWLTRNGYRMPEGADRVLKSYLRQGMRFFVARVNLEERSRLGYANLRPLQVAFETPKFMLPIRLGTVNADGPQDLFVYTLTRKGRVETTNYRTTKLPTGMDVPVFVKNEFGDFYRDLFTTQVERDGMRSVYLEYAWDMAWCDPCAADPLSPEELRELGVYWLDPDRNSGAARNVFVTRLHVRYDRDHFPDDLRFQETADRSNFQGRYVLRHAWSGEASCSMAADYRRGLSDRYDREAKTLASLTGWELGEIRRKIDWPEATRVRDEPWWRKIWSEGR